MALIWQKKRIWLMAGAVVLCAVLGVVAFYEAQVKDASVRNAGVGAKKSADEESVAADEGEELRTANEITQSDNGQAISITVGERIYLDLPDAYMWLVFFDDPAILALEGESSDAAHGYYVARKTGRTAIRATGKPSCRPECAAPDSDFSLTVEVVRHPDPSKLEESL